MKPVHEFSLSSPHTYKICRPTVPVLFCTHTFFVFLLSLFAYAPCVCTLPTNIYFSLCKANRPTSIIYTKKKEFAWKYNTSFIARWWLAFACAAAGQKAILYFLSFRCVVCANDPSIPILLMMHSHHFEGMWDMWPADGCMMVHIEIQKKCSDLEFRDPEKKFLRFADPSRIVTDVDGFLAHEAWPNCFDDGISIAVGGRKQKISFMRRRETSYIIQVLIRHRRQFWFVCVLFVSWSVDWVDQNEHLVFIWTPAVWE